MIAPFLVFAPIEPSDTEFRKKQGSRKVDFAKTRLKSFLVCMAFAVGTSGEYYIICFTISYSPGKLRLRHYAESD